MTSSTPQRTARGTTQLGQARDLPTGGLRPAAQPISAFMAPGRITPARPAEPAQVPNTPRFNIVQQGNGGNVQGTNPGFELAESLSRFNKNLVTIAGKGLEIYASSEYQKGQNEVWKAYTLSTEDQLLEGEAYAADNRKLYRQDPIAGLMMDQVNPFRAGGRQDAVSRIAGTEIGMAMLQDYRENAVDLAQLDPGDPRINAVKSRAVARVMTKFGITEWTPGFAKHVLPNLNRTWEQITAQQFEDRSRYLKDTVPRTAAVELATKLLDWRDQDRPRDQQLTQLGEILAREGRRMGLPGESMEMSRQAIIQARQQLLSAGEVELAEMLLSVPVGPPDKDGFQKTAAQMFGLEILETDDRFNTIRRKNSDLALDDLQRELDDEIAAGILEVPDGPSRQQIAAQISNQEKYQPLGANRRLQSINAVGRTVEEFQGGAFTTVPIEQFFADLEGGKFGFGSERNMQAAEEQFQENLQRVNPEERGKWLDRFNRWKLQEQNQPWNLINSAVGNATKALLAELFPNDPAAAALRGMGSIDQILGWGDARQQAVTQRLTDAMRTTILQRLDQARTKKGGELSDFAAQAEIREGVRLVSEQVRKEPEQFTGGLGAAAPQAAGGGGGGGGESKPQVQTFKPSSLGNMPDRQQRAQQWRNVPVLDAQSVDRMILPALRGEFPREFERFARDAGTTPQELLIRQMELYPNDFQALPKDVKDRLRRAGNQAKATEDHNDGRNPIGGALASIGNFVLNTLTGTAPAMAATKPVELPVIPAPAASPPPRPTPTPQPAPARPAPRPRPRPRNSIGLAYITVGGHFGRSADGMTQTLHGIKGVNGYDANHGVGNDHVHHGAKDPATAMALAKHLRNRGYPITEFKPWGAVSSVHKDPGHYNGSSFDIPVGVEDHAKVLRAIDDFYTGGNSETASVGTMALLDTSRPQGARAPAAGSRRAFVQALFPRRYEQTAFARQGGTAPVQIQPMAAGTTRNTYSSGGGGGGFKARYFKRMAFLESTLDASAFNSAGSGARGYFQLTGDTERDLIRRGHRSIVEKMKSTNLDTAIQGAYEYARLQHPEVDQLLAAGDVAGLDRLLNGLWVSLPGGSQPQHPSRYEQANRYLTD